VATNTPERNAKESSKGTRACPTDATSASAEMLPLLVHTWPVRRMTRKRALTSTGKAGIAEGAPATAQTVV
jgi:hypothetical protein